MESDMSNDLLQESLFLEMIKLVEEGKEIAKGEAIRIWCNTSHKMQEEYIKFFPVVLKDAEKIFEGEKYTENYAVLLTNFISENVLKAYPQIYEMCINKVIDRAEKGADVARIFKRLYLPMRNDLKDEKPELFKILIDYLKNNPKNIVEWYADTPIAKENFDIKLYFSGLEDLQDKEKDISLYVEKEVSVTLEELQQVTEEAQKFSNQKLSLQLKDAGELSLEKLEELKSKFNIQHIEVLNNARVSYQYTTNEFAKCREIIEELISGIDLGSEKDQNREKKIFGQVIKRLAGHMSYDYDHIKEKDRVKYMERVLKEKQDLTPEERSKIEKEMAEVDNQIDYVTPRNMIGGLINKTCVCAGYAEIVRNVFACLEIEATYVSGFPKDENESGHAWNQIKLDGKWYNMDLTWDRDRIVEGKEPCCMLMSENDFNGRYEVDIDEHYSREYEGHGFFSERRSEEHECDTTLSKQQVHKYITYDPTKQKKNWLRNISEKCSFSQIQESARSVIEAMTRHVYNKYEVANSKDGISR